MKQSLLKHYGKIIATILVLGLGAYFHKDVSDVVTKIDRIDENTSAPAPAVVVVVPVKSGADAGH